MRLKITNTSFKFCAIVHLSGFIAAIAWHMPSGSIARMLDQLTETFEFIFSLSPLENYYILSNPAADAIALHLITILFVTAIPSYTIGYPLFRRYFKKQL